jgi:hypothetical protein
MPNVNFLEVAAGMRKMYGIETVYYYIIDSKFRKSVSLQRWLNESIAELTEELPVLGDKPDDALARKCLAWVKGMMQYTGDTVTWGMTEKWQTPKESILSGKGDCEDGAILLYCLMKKNGFTDDQVFITCGNVNGGGHCYVVYVSSKDAVHHALDWCYWPTDSLRVKYGENPNYFFGTKEWFRFNSTGAYVQR